MENEKILQAILDELKELKEGQKALEEGQKALEEGQKVTNDRLSALEERQKALEEGQKALRVELNEKIDKLSGEIGTVLANVTDNVGREINNLKFIK